MYSLIFRTGILIFLDHVFIDSGIAKLGILRFLDRVFFHSDIERSGIMRFNYGEIV